MAKLEDPTLRALKAGIDQARRLHRAGVIDDRRLAEFEHLYRNGRKRKTNHTIHVAAAHAGGD